MIMGETYFQRVARGSAYYFVGAVIKERVLHSINLILERMLLEKR